MAGKKRPASPVAARKNPKQPRGDQSPVIDVDSEVDSDPDGLAAILALIKQQEESEALAIKLHSELNDGADVIDLTGQHYAVPSASTSNGASGSGSRGDAIDVDDEDVQMIDSPGPSSSDRDPQASHAAREAPGVSGQNKGKAKAASPSSTNLTLAQGITPESSLSSYSHPESTTPPDVILSEYRSTFTRTRKCTKCGGDVESPRGFVTFSATIPPPSLLYLLHAPCSSCKTNHCRGCFAPLSCAPSCRGPSLTNTKSSNWNKCSVETCCAEIRAIALFECLAGFDRQYINEKNNLDERAKARTASTNGNGKVKSVGPGGTGYSVEGYASVGSGYGWRGGSRSRGGGRGRGVATSQSNLSALAAHWEEILERVFKTLIHFLPSPYASDAQVYDLLPHPSITSLLSLSTLPELLASLLRNDSVDDWIKRAGVYGAVLGLLRRMADCEVSVEMLVGKGWERKGGGVGIGEWMWEEGDVEWELVDTGGRVKGKGRKTEEKETEKQIVRSPPLYEYFKKLTKQSEAFLAGASQLLDGESNEVDEVVVQGASLCGDIIAARSDIERTMAILGKSTSSSSSNNQDASSGSLSKTHSKGKARDPKVDMEREYSIACEGLAFEHINMGRPTASGGVLYQGYNYAKELEQTAGSTRNPKDRLHLIKELSAVSTGLPPGIWVRVDEVRNDAIKIMIAGPEGTPYAGGLFEFDCFMPLEYPNKPPLMHLHTTGGGRVRFNPNLYNNGKVCLSLLGTWAGRPEEQWFPYKSTLSQVLISIQSMIFVDAPFFNEPGYGTANLKDKRSINYNQNITLQTVRWAMVEWVKDEHKDGMWAVKIHNHLEKCPILMPDLQDVIASHFTIRGQHIRQCIEVWARSEPRIKYFETPSGAPLTNMAIVTGVPFQPEWYAEPDEYWDGEDDDDDEFEETKLNIPAPTVKNKGKGKKKGGTKAKSKGSTSAKSAAAGSSSSAGTIDLLESYDQGLEKIKGWLDHSKVDP